MQETTTIQKTFTQLLEYIEVNALRAGQNLPAERKLAEHFQVSRNTVREAIRMLQERDLVEVVQGSGCYLKEKSKTIGAATIENHLEALYHFLPPIVSAVAERATAGEIQRLEEIIVSISQSILKQDYSSLIFETQRFLRAIAEEGGNPLFPSVLGALKLTNLFTEELLSRLTEAELNTMFAGYVETLSAIKRHDAAEVSDIAKKHILNICSYGKRHFNLLFSESLERKIEEI